MSNADSVANDLGDYVPGGVADRPKRVAIGSAPWTWRPSLSIELLVLLASVFFATVSSAAFWRQLNSLGLFGDSSGWLTAISLLVAMVALTAAMLCLVLNRWTSKPILIALLVINSALGYFMTEYSVYIDPGMVRNALRTDTRETVELITPGLIITIVVQGVLPSLLVWRLRIKRRPYGRALRYRLLVLLGCLATAALFLAISFQDLSALMRNNKQLRYLIAPGNYLVSVGRVLLDESRDADGARLSVGEGATLTGHTTATKPHLLVIVVGETIRAQNWGLNGYQRQTTPQLAKMNLINFRDVTACGSNTEVSVPCMFSAYGRRNYDRTLIRQSESLLHALERAGVKTLWRDNQTGCKGVCAGLDFESFREPRKDPLCDAKFCRDEILLRGLTDVARNTNGDLVVVLHQLGNHGPSYYQRYPESLRRFIPDCRTADLGECSRQEIVNAYDNAVLATDDFLARTITLLDSDKSRDSAMIYVSDHGESLGENNLYLHGIPEAIAPDTQLRVPMVMWMSSGMAANQHMKRSCLQDKALTAVSHDNLFHSVLGIMQVKTKEYDPALDLFSPCR